MFVLTGCVHQCRNTSKHLEAPKISNRKTNSHNHHSIQLRLPKKMEQALQPEVSAEWSLDPTTHSFSSNPSPTLTFSLTNHSDQPITIYNEYLVPSRLLAEGSFTIFDLTADTEVHQLKTRFCDFVPPTNVHVPLRESMFHTLYPGTPVFFIATFGISKSPPRPSLPHQPLRPRGVHGLEIGHEYILRPGQGWGWVRWWEYGEKEEVINPPTGKLDGRTVAYKHSKAPHPGFQINIGTLPAIKFKCVE
ncbi:MAG: hypothetical protein LQ337_006036 [Flavoplaca oasis]|nr:MAG: hypothetical protein LQ337_006036 [Flavoplaca oasis]